MKRLLNLCFSVLSIPALLSAATLNGSVRSLVGVLPKAQVIIYSAVDDREIAQLVTDASGVYQYTSLSSGDYRLRIGAAGFITIEVQGIHASADSLSLPPILLDVGLQCGSVPVIRYLEPLPEQETQARISGSVVDRKSGRLLENATVTLVCLSREGCTMAPQLAHGRFLWDVVPGTYKMKIQRKGYFADEYKVFYAQAGFHTVYDPLYLDRCRGQCLPSQKPIGVCE